MTCIPSSMAVAFSVLSTSAC
uniref:Uncharacterized protein n=1 Tax=Anguilla anguilla TaxID=7936 RepID=A0A0E9VBK3_ANGAN